MENRRSEGRRGGSPPFQNILWEQGRTGSSSGLQFTLSERFSAITKICSVDTGTAGHVVHTFHTIYPKHREDVVKKEMLKTAFSVMPAMTDRLKLDRGG